MANLKDHTLSLLNNDPTLISLAPGLFVDSEDLPPDGGNWDFCPKHPDDENLMLVWGIIRWKQMLPTGPVGLKARGQTVEIYVYAPIGEDIIDLVHARIDALLDQELFVTDDFSMAHFQFAMQSKSVTAQEYRNANSKFQRYLCTKLRQ